MEKMKSKMVSIKRTVKKLQRLRSSKTHQENEAYLCDNINNNNVKKDFYNKNISSTLAIAFAEAVGLPVRRWRFRRRSGGKTWLSDSFLLVSVSL
jgi:hypothetical protein